MFALSLGFAGVILAMQGGFGCHVLPQAEPFCRLPVWLAHP